MKQLVDHEFVARGEAFRGDVSSPITIRGIYSDFEPKPVQCIVMPEASVWPRGFNAFDEVNPAQLKGKAHDGDGIWISGLSQVSSTHSGDQMHWKGIAETFLKGDLDEFDATDGEIICTAYIPPTPIAMADVSYTLSYDGTIVMDLHDGTREGVRWNTTRGLAELIDNYNYVDEKTGINKTVIRIQRCQIVIKFKSTGLVSLGDILRELPTILDETLWLVTFLCRKRIAWYAGKAVFIPGAGPTKNFKQAIIHRRSWLGYESQMGAGESQLDLLVPPKELRKELFQELITNYETSEHKEVIRRTIPHILMSYERGYLEAHIGNAYLALESLVAGLSLDKDDTVAQLLQSAAFKRLTKKIKQTIHEEVKDPATAQGIIKKLGELNRPSFLDRLMKLIEKYDMAVATLWPSGVNIESELHDILKRRNIYIHQGRLDDIDRYLYDFVRLRNLVELWILKLLNCPDEVINLHALRNVIPIDRV
jgi:hypothetical protein